nr:MAG TPA: hypothetical protein [Bacteriophage sp.]DAI57857.1 MAG TPA: hypothetical protein [Caudoviricetes sp.]
MFLHSLLLLLGIYLIQIILYYHLKIFGLLYLILIQNHPFR